MQSQKDHYDPRFYFININSLKFKQRPHKDVTLQFKIGNKSSQSKFTLKEDISSNENEVYQDHIEKQVHILKYGAEQFLNIYLKIGNQLNGFSRVLLPPIFERPHTKHNINAILFQNVFQTSSKSGEAAPSAQLNFDIYFQFNFQGILEVIPVSASLQRNIAKIGQMKPKVILQMEGVSWCSLPAEGGIRPHWSGHFHAKMNEDQGIISAIEENLKSNKLEEWARLLKMASNSLGITTKQQSKPQESKPYFDCTEFSMKCAGSYLNIEIISDPFIGSKPDIIGTAKIRVEDEGLLKLPRKSNQKLFQVKFVKLYHEDKILNVKVEAGVLKLFVRFVFDKEKVIKKNTKYSLL